MIMSFINALGLDDKSSQSIRSIAQSTGIPADRVRHYQESHILPNEDDLISIEYYLGYNRIELSLKMGLYNAQIKDWLAKNANQFSQCFTPNPRSIKPNRLTPSYKTNLGRLYHADCMDLFPQVKNDSVDLVFADPPFNLNKCYGKNISDKMISADYERWCQQWLDECIRVLKPGGSMYIWHIPRWAQKISAYTSQFLEFRHWISVKMNYGLPIAGRLYPSHYSLLYFTKGKKPSVFAPDRIPIEACRHCGLEQRDYGGHKDKLNPNGLSLPDVWLDINPVKHNKRRIANELPMNLLDRILEMSTNPGDLILDPFGGAGVSYITAQLKNRRWIGCELGDISPILDRFSDLKQERQELRSLRKEANKLFSDPILQIRIKRKVWTEPVEANQAEAV
jgi:site-specific DNA-methyltransferase (adenine-specific)